MSLAVMEKHRILISGKKSVKEPKTLVLFREKLSAQRVHVRVRL